MRLLVFCEAESDFRTVSGLVHRLLREEGPAWVREHLEHYPPDHLVSWIGDGGRGFFNLHHVYGEAERRGIRLPYGRFDSRRGAPWYLAATTAFLIARHIAEASEPLDAVFHVWDADQQGEERRAGQDQARGVAVRAGHFEVVLGCADLEREAWVLAGFDPENDLERRRLEDERRALSFCPCTEAHRLRDNKDHEARSPKRVLRALTDDDREREERCWTHASLELLRSRGEGSGLAAFLIQVKEHVMDALERRGRT